MTNEEHGRRVPEENISTAEPDAEPTTESGAKSGGRIGGFILAMLVVGATFAKEFFSKAPVSRREAAAAETSVLTAAEAELPPDRIVSVEETEPVPELHEKVGTLFVLCAFLVGIAGGVGFLFLYWSGGSNLLLGATLAFFFGGMGLTLSLYPHWLMRYQEVVEPREELSSGPVEREATSEDFCAGAHDVRRRAMLKWMAAGAAGIFAAMFVSLLRSLGMPPGDSLFSTVWKPGQRLVTDAGTPIRVDSLQPGSSITVFPENSRGSEKTQTVLIRVQEQLLQLPKDRAHWAPMGYVAYSRICTHAGCPVGLFQSQTNLLLCPCHQSTFDVLRAARPTGGPAARPLPQLPLYADSEGNLRAGGGFSSPPGPGFWGMPS